MKSKIKKFWANFVMTFKVQKKALIRVFTDYVLPTLLISVLLFGITSIGVESGVCYWLFIVLGILWRLFDLLKLKEDYKKVVERAAEIQIDSAQKSKNKSEKIAEKKSIKAQNKSAYARRVAEKYHNKEK